MLNLYYEGWTQEFDPQIASNGSSIILRPSNIVINLDVREAPNLTATVEGPLADKSVFVVDQDVWVNGTARSLGPTPVIWKDSLSLSMRENGPFTSWSEIFNMYCQWNILPYNSNFPLS